MLKFLNKHANTERASFHMPGHKGSAFYARMGYGASMPIPDHGMFSPDHSMLSPDHGMFSPDHDITEIPGADDLRHPDGIIKTITDRYAALYGGGRAFISVNGSSALIMAAIMTCVKPGHKLLAAADSHISVRNGAELAGAEIVYVEPQVLEPWGENQVLEPWGKDDELSRAIADGNTADSSRAGTGGEILSAPGSLVNKGIETSSNCDAVSDQSTDVMRHANVCISFPGGLSAKDVADALDADPDIDAVILPSPNYFGIVSDVKTIAEEVHKREKVLIVDQAHGAHLKMFADAVKVTHGAHLKMLDGLPVSAENGFSGVLPVPAEECGADIVIVSTHKTMASFTQTAVANIFGSCAESGRSASYGCEESGRSAFSGRVDPDEYEKKLLMLESTSPSYILMESLAVNADIMEKHGSEMAASWRADLDWFYENVKKIPGIRVLTRELVKNAAAEVATGADFDDSKIVIDFNEVGMSGEEAEKVLMEKGVYPEFSTGSIVMCLTGIGNVREDYELLLEALAEIAGK